MPATQREALDALAADELLLAALGARCSPAPTWPCGALSGRPIPQGDEAFEQRGHFEKY